MPRIQPGLDTGTPATGRTPTGTARRDLLKWGTLGGIAATLPVTARARPAAEVRRYVRLGRTGLNISDIGFGSSRLRTGEEHLVAHALDAGINFFDTAESYTGGEAETVLGRALKGRRDQVVIASKTHVGTDTTAAALMSALDASLRRLQTDHVDLYFQHAVNDVAALANPEWLAFVEAARRGGKLRFTAVSGHAGHLIECLDHALDHDLIDAMLVAYNFGQDPAFHERFTRSLDLIAVQPDLPRVLAKAHARDVGVIAMKVLRGARLHEMRQYESGGATYAQAALRWTLANPDVNAAIISMTDAAAIDEFLGASGDATVTDADVRLLQHYARITRTTYCNHACNLCDGACPYQVPVSDVMRVRMYARDYGDVRFARDEYAALGQPASPCLTCSGEPCQGACPNGLSIAELCHDAQQLLA